jgi:hypothetical protein
MPARLPQDDFAALVRRAGVALSPTEVEELYGAWQNVEPMLERIRAGTRPREAEPALIFRPESI